MDFGTLIGLILAITVIVVVMILDGGSPAELFANPQTILLTLGGSIVAASISAPFETVLGVPKLLALAFKGEKAKGPAMIEALVKMADKARREGLLALEGESQKINDAFLRKGLMLVVDGVDPAQVRAILEIEIEQMSERHAKGIALINGAGGFAPTFGIIGTVMGLITVLKQLSNPEALGEAIASAFLATLWGLLSANLIWLPLGGKLKTKSEEEVAYRRLLLDGVVSIQAGENPRLLKEKLSSFLPPKERGAKEGRGAEAAGASGKTQKERAGA